MDEITFDIFRGEMFTATTMTDAINEVSYTPQRIGQLGLFDPRGVRTTTVSMYRDQQTISVVPTTERGAPPVSPVRRGRSGIQLTIPRLAEIDRIHSYELVDLLRGPYEAVLQTLANEITDRQQVILDEFELTRERMRLGALQGKLLDADNTVLVDYYAEFGFAEPTEIALNIAAIPEGELAIRLTDLITRPMTLTLKGRAGNMVQVGALVGDTFWNALIKHPDVRAIYALQAQAAPLTEEGRRLLAGNAAWSEVEFGGIRWINYRGTDDGSTISIGADKARFFPMNVRNAFKVFYGPGEGFRDLGTTGRPLYTWLDYDQSANQEYVDIHVRNYPLYATTVPQALFRARSGA